MTRKKFLPLERFDEFPSYKGGHTCVYGGYIWEFCPGHHLQNRWGWVAQHRMIAEDKLGRPLRRSKNHHIGEHVHHVDGCPTNNAPDNLEVLTKSQHHSLETKRWMDETYGWLTDEVVAGALTGRSIKEAAAYLGVTHMTLRRRAPGAVAPRKRSPPHDTSDPKLIERIRQFAESDQYCLLDVSMSLRISERSIRKICKQNGFQWRPKSKKGMKKRTYRGKPTQWASELRESGIDPETTYVRNQFREQRRERRRQREEELAG